MKRDIHLSKKITKKITKETSQEANQEAMQAVQSDSIDSPPHSEQERMQGSLFGEILDWMLMPLLLLWPVSIGITYLIATSIANEPFDRALEDRVTVLAQQVKEYDGKLTAQIPYSARDILRADDIDNVYLQVSGPDRELLTGDSDLPLPNDEDQPVPWSVLLRDERMRNADVRIAYTYVNLQKRPQDNAEAAPRYALVQVAETLDKRQLLANQIIKGVILPEFIILPIALTLLWFALTRGLSPLATLQEHIRSRRSDDLSPIDPHGVPEEISPLVRSLNEMLMQVSQSIQMQKRFIADAAHQMKTPLAGMRMQSELAMRQSDRNEIQRSLEQLSKSSESATRLVNQLLALARAENQSSQAIAFDLIELNELARGVVQDWVQTAFTRKIDLGFEDVSHAVNIGGNATMLRELMNNLIDNALRYTPQEGRVTVRVAADVERELAFFEVDDNGPGIPANERTHVLERFYRILGSNTEGSGLGLSIVREIAQHHHASVDIFSNPRSHDPSMPGCLFRISLPLVQASHLDNTHKA